MSKTAKKSDVVQLLSGYRDEEGYVLPALCQDFQMISDHTTKQLVIKTAEEAGVVRPAIMNPERFTYPVDAEGWAAAKLPDTYLPKGPTVGYRKDYVLKAG